MQNIITEKVGGKVILLLQKDLDASDQRLTRRLQSLRQPVQELSVWVDCASLECIKTYGFCHFVNQLLVLKNYNATITLMNLGEPHRRLLQVLGVDALFTTVPSLEEAYHQMQAS